MAPRAGRRSPRGLLRRQNSSSVSPELRNRFEALVNAKLSASTMPGGKNRRGESPSPARRTPAILNMTMAMGMEGEKGVEESQQKLIGSALCCIHRQCSADSDECQPPQPEVAVVSGGKGGSKRARRRQQKRTLDYDLAPDFMKHNRFILKGYRKSLSFGQCIKSCFYWNNETINIWSHILGVVWLMILLFIDIGQIYDLAPSYYDIVVAVLMVLSFQACLSLSVVFHIFNCSSEKVCSACFKWDVFGIAWATFTFYWTGIYCAYSCFAYWRYFYWITAFSAFCVTIVLHLWEEFLKEKYRPQRVVIFTIWAVFGFVPTFHWFFLYGGWSHPWVKTIVGRVLVLYFLLGCGFFFYLSRIPERFKPGYFDFVGSSHQWWHLFAVLSFWWWHNTGIECFRYLKVYGCPNLPGVEEDPYWRPLLKTSPDLMNQTMISDVLQNDNSSWGFF